jgi:hypothetical protein
MHVQDLGKKTKMLEEVLETVDTLNETNKPVVCYVTVREFKQ